MVKILNSTYEKSDLDKVAEAVVHLDKDLKKVIKCSNRIWGVVYGTLVKRDTTPVYLEVKTGSKPFNYGYYPVPNINKNILARRSRIRYPISTKIFW